MNKEFEDEFREAWAMYEKSEDTPAVGGDDGDGGGSDGGGGGGSKRGDQAGAARRATAKMVDVRGGCEASSASVNSKGASSRSEENGEGKAGDRRSHGINHREKGEGGCRDRGRVRLSCR